MAVGIYDIQSLLAIKFQSVKAFGLNTIQDVIQRDLEMHNQLVTDMVGSLCETTTDAQRTYGTSSQNSMQEVDEYGRANTVRMDVGDTVGFPLRRYQYALGWTADWFSKKTPGDMAQIVVDSEAAHKREIVTQIKRAIFLSSNYTFRDHLVDYVSLNVKRFVNADSARIPNGPYGLTFDGSTHTHYLGATSLSTTLMDAAILSLLEHGLGGNVKVAFNYANEAAVRGLTGFTPYLDQRIVTPASSRDVTNSTLNVTSLYDRAIGLYGAAEVVIKPWVPAGYFFMWDDNPSAKPLAFRQQEATDLQGLRIPATFDAFPLHAEYMQAEFGIGVWNRTNGVVGKFTASGSTYEDPTNI